MALGDTPQVKGLEYPYAIARRFVHTGTAAPDAMPGSAQQAYAALYALPPQQLAALLDGLYRRASLRQLTLTVLPWADAGGNIVQRPYCLGEDINRTYFFVKNLDANYIIYVGLDFSPWPANQGVAVNTAPNGFWEPLCAPTNAIYITTTNPAGSQVQLIYASRDAAYNAGVSE